MIPRNEGQQELFGTVLGTNEADKMGKASDRSLRTFMRTKKRIIWFLGCVTARNMAVREVERINEIIKK